MFKKTKALLLNAVMAVGLALGLTAGAHAALPPEATAAISEMTTTATDMFGAVFPIIASIVGFLVVIKLFKRFTSKV